MRPKTTNLPFVVWVSQRAGTKQDVRVQVAHSAKVIPSQMGVYSARPFAHLEGPGLSPSDAKLLEDWIGKSRAVLVDFWNADIECTEDLINKIQAVWLTESFHLDRYGWAPASARAGFEPASTQRTDVRRQLAGSSPATTEEKPAAPTCGTASNAAALTYRRAASNSGPVTASFAQPLASRK